MEEEIYEERIRLIIIGNGFDLAHKLKTSFSDYFITIIRSKIIEWLESSDRPDTIYINDYLSLTPKPNHDIDKRQLHTLESIREQVNFDTVGIYDILDKNSTYENWSDVEYEYYEMLSTTRKEKLRRLNNSLEIFKEDFKNYLKEYIDPQDKFYNYDFEKLFKQQVDRKYVIDKYIFLNFNYTNTLHPYIVQLSNSEKCQRIDIHGSIHDDIVIGYGDEDADHYRDWEQSSEDEYLRFSKSPMYALNDSYKILIGSLNNFYEVVIVGHSCGITDRTLLKELLENKRCKKIRIYHHNGKKGFLKTVFGLMRQFGDKVKLRNKLEEFDSRFNIPQEESRSKIIEAWYGVEDDYDDVLDKVRNMNTIKASNDLVEKDRWMYQTKHLILKIKDYNDEFEVLITEDGSYTRF